MLTDIAAHGTRVALRYKKWGVWQQRTWQDVAEAVQEAMDDLQAQDFAVGQQLSFPSRATPETLYRFLAVLERGGRPVIEETGTTHAYPIEDWDLHARLGLVRNRLQAQDEVFGSPYWELIIPWVLAGFRWYLPETPETEEADRREIRPTVIIAGSAFYRDWARHIQGRLRPEALSWFAWHRLRRVLGLQRVRIAVVQGEELPQAVVAFYAHLGLDPQLRPFQRPWPVEPSSKPGFDWWQEGSTHAFAEP